MPDGIDQYEYNLKVHQLRPWPVQQSSHELLAVGWQRGQVRGHIPAVNPKLTSKQYGVYQFNDEIRIAAKLRKVRGHMPVQTLLNWEAMKRRARVRAPLRLS